MRNFCIAPSGTAGLETSGRLAREATNFIAWSRLEPRVDGAPTLVFLPGFRSSMDGQKALTLRDRAATLGCGCLRFDYFGHGRSTGEPMDGTIGRWRGDALAVIDAVAPAEAKVVLVGSSMGGWLALRAAAARPARVAGIATIAAAPDFTVDLLPARLTPAQRATLDRDGHVSLPTPYGPDPYPVSRALLTEGGNHRVLAPNSTVLETIACPVRLIHGMCDTDIPWQRSAALTEKLSHAPARLRLVHDGDHRLSRPVDLGLLGATVEDLVRLVSR